MSIKAIVFFSLSLLDFNITFNIARVFLGTLIIPFHLIFLHDLMSCTYLIKFSITYAYSILSKSSSSYSGSKKRDFFREEKIQIYSPWHYHVRIISNFWHVCQICDILHWRYILAHTVAFLFVQSWKFWDSVAHNLMSRGLAKLHFVSSSRGIYFCEISRWITKGGKRKWASSEARTWRAAQPFIRYLLGLWNSSWEFFFLLHLHSSFRSSLSSSLSSPRTSFVRFRLLNLHSRGHLSRASLLRDSAHDWNESSHKNFPFSSSPRDFAVVFFFFLAFAASLRTSPLFPATPFFRQNLYIVCRRDRLLRRVKHPFRYAPPPPRSAARRRLSARAWDRWMITRNRVIASSTFECALLVCLTLRSMRLIMFKHGRTGKRTLNSLSQRPGILICQLFWTVLLRYVSNGIEYSWSLKHVCGNERCTILRPATHVREIKLKNKTLSIDSVSSVKNQKQSFWNAVHTIILFAHVYTCTCNTNNNGP